MFDVVVIGGGPAGVTSALRARELGASVALVERGNLGGTCTNDGCVPTRVLAHAARLVREAGQFADYGLLAETPTVDFERVINRTQRIVYEVQEKKQIQAQLEEVGVHVHASSGHARFHDANTLVLGDKSTLEARKFIICAGGHARRLPFPGAEHALTHSDVWTMRSLPESVAVIGGAATGCQLASVFAAFGSNVTLLEVAPRILPGEDEAISDAVTDAFLRRGIEVITDVGGVERLSKQSGSFRLEYSWDGEGLFLDVAAVVMAVGWPGNADELNLEAAGVKASRGYVEVDDSHRTTSSNVFAAGDITGRMMLVQSATYEGRVAAESAVMGETREFAHDIVAHGGFTDPEYASVGLTERQAQESHDCVVSTVPYASLDRGVIDGRPEGFCKLIVDRGSRELLGAHIVGEQAVEVVQIAATAMRASMTVEELADVELAYPTFTAIVGLAARRAVRDLGLVTTSSGWGAPEETRAVEWEHRGG